MFNATEEIKDAANYPTIRVLIVHEEQSTVPLDDLPVGGILQSWSLPGKTEPPKQYEAGDFSWLLTPLNIRVCRNPLCYVVNHFAL